ncbi:MAG TPA: hypothetical protein VM369_06240 [Candidatus Binatia bacterium]|nr:hypothetical protein [Candidatus Binatia bacterium]
MTHLKAFIAGFVSTLVFHQSVLWLLAHGTAGIPVWDMTPVPPLGVPRVVSLAFWGGVWGIALWAMIRNTRGTPYWLRALVIGALGPTLVAMFVVAPLKGKAIAFGWDPKFIVGGLLVNAAWGLGTAVLMRAMPRS